MTAAALPTTASPRPGPGEVLARVTRQRWFRPAAVVVLMFVALVFIPAYFNNFWIGNFRQMGVFAIVCASAGMLYGRVGLVSLGQVAPYGIGTWVTIRLLFATSLPYVIVILLAGLVAMALGVIIGLPALRVSGLYLALVTLMLVAGVELMINEFKFANGGGGFRGVVKSLSDVKDVPRPSFAADDVGYYRFVVIGAFLMFMLAALFLSRKPGRAWASIRQSEAAALSAGIHITRYKLLAFALASFMAGIAGGLFAGEVKQGMSVTNFNRQAAIFLIAAVIMGGFGSLWGAVLGGFLATCFLKFLIQNVVGHQFWDQFSFSVFGFGLLTNLIQSTKVMEKKGLL
jgi:branched-chain amino acid transport system permease protein